MFMLIRGRQDFVITKNTLVAAIRCHIGQQTLLSMVYGPNMQRLDILRLARKKPLR
jgi:hypothetical protein